MTRLEFQHNGIVTPAKLNLIHSVLLSEGITIYKRTMFKRKVKLVTSYHGKLPAKVRNYIQTVLNS